MRPAFVLIIAAGLAAAPAAAQQTAPANVGDSANAATVVEPDLAADPLANDMLADPTMPVAVAPEAAPADVGYEPQRPQRRPGFPWGLLGLLGLAGLLGRGRPNRPQTDTDRSTDRAR